MAALLFALLFSGFLHITYSQSYMDTLACDQVSGGPDSLILIYDDFNHMYINAGDKEILRSETIIKGDSAYYHIIMTPEVSRHVISPTRYLENPIEIENIQIGYQEGALLVTWEITDSLWFYADKFHIFYAEAEIEHIGMLDSALYWGMSYENVWQWEIGENMYDYFYVLPKKVFPAYTSLIRIGIIAELWYVNDNGEIAYRTYSELFLAPDIYNKTPQQPVSVVISQ